MSQFDMGAMTPDPAMIRNWVLSFGSVPRYNGAVIGKIVLMPVMQALPRRG